MTAKAPQPMPEGVVRPQAPKAPPKLRMYSEEWFRVIKPCSCAAFRKHGFCGCIDIKDI